MTFGIDTLAKMAGVKLADLSNPEGDLRGRVDVLASKLIEHGVTVMNDPAMAATYRAARPLIDGAIANALGKFRIAVPSEISSLLQQQQERR
jgi:hypothetical protein